MSIEIEVEPEEVKKAFDQAYKEFGQHTSVPGFRKGKAPRAMLERFVAEDRVKERAAEILAFPAFEKAVEEAGIEPFGQAEYEVVQIADNEPFKFKAKVPLPPKVELGEYKGIKVEKLTQAVSDADIQKEIDAIRERAAKVENVEGRPVQKGDLAIIEMTDAEGGAPQDSGRGRKQPPEL
jgi:trigger factor